MKSSKKLPTPPDRIRAAARELREVLGDTQQQFAQRLGLAISTVVRYELTRPPKGKALAQLKQVAMAYGQVELAHIFADALRLELDWQTRPWSELVDQIVDKIQKHIAMARGGPPVQGPGAAAPDTTLAFLEELLIQLRFAREGSASRLVDVLAKERSRETGETYERASVAVLTKYPYLYELDLHEKAQAAEDTQFQKDFAVPYLAKKEPSKPRQDRLRKGGSK